ncbi:MAG TPA: hypothetical protein VF408_08235 [Sediminibacterium sp.]|jgi:hypothetical protein
MSNGAIRTYDDLVQEQRRLKLQLAGNEQALRQEFAEIKQKIKPVTKMIDFLGKITTRDKNNPLLNTGIAVGVNLLVKKLLLRNAGWVSKLVMPFLVKNFLSHEAQEHPEWMRKLAHFFKKTFGKKPEAAD